jgi:tetratricopeptide (TPR) repeat protein
MPTPDQRLLSLGILLLAGLLLGLPWAAGGRSPTGHAGLALLFALAAAATLQAKGRHPILRCRPLLLIAGVLVGGSALHTIYPDRTIQHLLLLLGYLLAGSLAAAGCRHTPWAGRVLLTAMVASGVLTAGIGMYRLLQGTEGGLYATVLTGPFGYPNAMAGFLLLSGGAALAIAQGEENRLVRSAAVAGLALSVLGIYLTGSRGAALAGASGLAAWAVAEHRSWWARRRLWLGLTGIGIVLVLARWSDRITFLVSNLGMPADHASWDPSILWRFRILRWTWAMAMDHVWWGVGPGAFPVALKRYQQLPYVSGENPHNLYVELAAEYGLPAAILAAGILGAFLYRLGSASLRAAQDDPVGRRLGTLLGTLVAFMVHSAVDLDWSFPAIAFTAATILGIAQASLGGNSLGRAWNGGVWRITLLLLLTAAALLTLTRYYASTLVAWARAAPAGGEVADVQRNLVWALRLNPLSFPAHLWLVRAQIRSGASQAALDIADRAVRIAPLDPDSQYLAGEAALAAGRLEDARAHFRKAVDRAPSAQLRYHAALVESAVRAGSTSEAWRWYDEAAAIFSSERVLAEDARCLAPGDRYLLARMSRILAGAGSEGHDPVGRLQLVKERAWLLAQPDPRGICATRGRPGQTSPEKAAESFWQAMANGGWLAATALLSPDVMTRIAEQDGGLERGRPPLRARLVWVAELTGGERLATLRAELEIETAVGDSISRCARMDLRLVGNDWYVDALPILEPGPCLP